MNFHSDILALFGRVHLQDQVLAMLRGQVADIISGTVFVFLGLIACGIAAMRRRSRVRALIWLGIWSAAYGAMRLTQLPAVLAVSPRWFQVGTPYVNTVMAYLILVVALLFWLELSQGKLRFFLHVVMFVGLAIGSAGIVIFLLSGPSVKLMPYNNLLAVCTLIALVMVVAVPKLARKFLVTRDSRVLLVGTLVFAVEAMYSNVLGSRGQHIPTIWDSLGFAVFLFSLGYVALETVFASERRLLSIDRELAIAREIQTSILPSGSPEIKNLRITAAYRPMTAVAGDFYDFIPIDQNRIGFLVADVSGHGVPAALIAAMTKVAMQSVVSCAHDPRAVLRGLNRTLFGQPRDQFVTASYLWLDTENRKARYSAAGHPPLLRWREGKLERIESNGLIFGVTPEPDYPVCDMQISPGDRFMLYTDGVIEPENDSRESFGERKLEEVFRNNQSRPAAELSDQLLSEIRGWQPPSTTQQDDITLIVIDVVE
jgi:sigma-B regulation protein RsbU (phosphoserine phosphatase)